MASPAFAQARRSWVFLRLLVLIGAVALVSAAAVGVWFYTAARSSLPQLDGSIGLPGLSAPVSVVRDPQGVPHISASGMEDLLFAQGYVTAQDRLWQMDMTRRFAAGELAEVLGASYLASDRTQRTLGMRQVAERSVAATSATDHRLLDAYARGVNAYIASHRNRLPVEFRVLRYQPQPWTPADTMLVACMFNQMLNLFSIEDMLARERVLARVPPELAADLFPNTSSHDHPPGQDTPPAAPKEALGRNSTAWTSASGGQHTIGMVAIDRRPPAIDSFLPASNNWAISGGHTVSGKPLLSNDMHLPHHIPNVWYEVHLTSGDFNVAGVTAPGLPFVLVGHNRRIAWGFTNLGPAVTDLYVETFDQRGRYLAPDGWRQPEHRHEIIHVRGQTDVSLDVTTTRHGPIVTGVLPGETRTLALQWTLWDPRQLASTFEAIREADAARNWNDFCRAFAQFGGPGQNVVYADVDGHIGYHATGWVPLRKAGDATRPVPGSVDTYDWAGYLPFDRMPTVFDPPSGLIATANARVTPDNYPYLISAEWMSPYRSERIYQVLQSGRKFSAADMLALQTDIFSGIDWFFAHHFAEAVQRTPGASPRARQAATLLSSWDGRVTVDSAAANITVAARRRLQRLLLEPILGPAGDDPKIRKGWRMYTWHNSLVWLENVVSKRPQRWLPRTYGSWDDLLTAAVEQTVSAGNASSDLGAWQWGPSHPVYLQHPLFGRVPVLNRWTGPGLQPQSGDRETVKQVGRGFGPSERLTVDLGNLDASTLNIVTGESGNFLSPYYMDQWQAWYDGTSFNLPFSPAAVRNSRRHELRLEPK